MQCPKCGLKFRSRIRFCVGCGEGLLGELKPRKPVKRRVSYHVVCPKCKKGRTWLNKEDGGAFFPKYCKECGSLLVRTEH